MSGFGISLQPEIMRQVADRRLWRESSFLHQLSPGGGLLWADNHDSTWLRLIQERLGREENWLEIRHHLASRASGEVRGLLWRTSRAWLGEMRELRPRLEVLVVESGIEDIPSLIALDEEIRLRDRQVRDLAWCASDTSKGAIEIIR